MKYIHYDNLPIGNLLISDSKDESKRGFKLFVEFECEKETEVLTSMINGFRMKFDGNIVENEDVDVFGRYIHDELEYNEEFKRLNYQTKMHHDGYVAVHSRLIEQY